MTIQPPRKPQAAETEKTTGGNVRSVKGFIAGIVCIVSLAAAPGLFAGQEYILAGGTRAVIEGRPADPDRRGFERVRSLRPGQYNIRGGNRAIYVTPEKIEVRERPPEIR